LRDVHIRHEMEPYIGFVPSLFLCAIGTALALLFADNLPLAAADRASLFVPTSLATLLAGFLVLTTRRKAMSPAGTGRGITCPRCRTRRSARWWPAAPPMMPPT